MRHFFYRFRVILLYWGLVCFLPFAAHAKPTGEIIFIHPDTFKELWVTHIEDTRNARMIFRRGGEVIEKLSVQKGGSFLVFVSYAEQLQEDVFLLDKNRARPKEINLTKGRYDGVSDAAISINGDVVFTTGYTEPPEARGIYLIPNHKLHHRTPKVTLLKHVSAFGVEWAPNGKDIAYSTDSDVFLLNYVTGENVRIDRNTRFPVFSPAGDKIAVTHILPRMFPDQLSIRSLANLEPLKRVKVETPPEFAGGWRGLTWSPDGRYLIYTTQNRMKFFPDYLYHNTAVSIADGPHESILENLSQFGVPAFDWTSIGYAVEPTNKLTTLWGKLKQQD